MWKLDIHYRYNSNPVLYVIRSQLNSEPHILLPYH
jgi:hypothetical protein